MKNNTAELSETTRTQNELKEGIIKIIVEHADQFEEAIIEIFFIASYSDNGAVIDKQNIDYLHLLYKLLQDAKEISQTNETNILKN